MWTDVAIFPPRDELDQEKVEERPTGVRFKPSLKARVQEIAAREGTSFPEALFRLLIAGIKVYEEEKQKESKQH